MDNLIPEQPVSDNTPPVSNPPDYRENPEQPVRPEIPASSPNIVSMSAALGVQPQTRQPAQPKWPVYLAAFFGITLLGVGGVLASRVWDPMWNPFRPSPEEVLAKMAENQKNFKTVHASGSFSFDITYEEETMSIGANYEGDIDSSDKENIKYDLEVKAALGMEGDSFEFGGQVVGADGDSYVKLNSLGALKSMFNVGSSEPESKKWTKYGKNWRSDLVKVLEEKKEELQLTDDDIQSYRDEAAKEEEKDASGEVAEEASKIVAAANIYKVIEELPDEKIGDVDVYHYKVVLNNDNFRKAMEEISALEAGSEEDDFDGEQLGEFLNAMGELSGDIWIGKKDNLFYRFSAEKQIDYGAIAEAINADSQNYAMNFLSFLEDTDITLKLQADLSDYNKEVKLEIPDDFEKAEDQEIEKLVASLDSKRTMNNYGIISAMEDITDAASAYNAKNKSYLKLGDSSDYLKIADEIKSYSSAGATLKASKTKYCAYVKTYKSGNSDSYGSYYTSHEYWCVDSTGNSSGTDDDPSQKGYCDGATFVCPADTSSW